MNTGANHVKSAARLVILISLSACSTPQTRFGAGAVLAFDSHCYRIYKSKNEILFASTDEKFVLNEKTVESPSIWLGKPISKWHFGIDSYSSGETFSLETHGETKNASFHERIKGMVNSPWLHVTVTAKPKSEEEIEGILTQLHILEGNTNPLWVPNLRPHLSHVIGHHCFRSPAIIFERASIIPDLNEFPHPMPFKMALDINVNDRAVRFGYLDWTSGNSKGGKFELFDHTYYCHNPESRLKLNKTVSYSYYILFHNGNVSDTARFMWKMFGKKYMEDVKPQVVPLQRYAEYSYPSVFEREWKDVDEKSGGVMQFALGFVPNPTSVGFEAWHCNVRSAYGLYYYGKLLDKKDWVERAIKIKNLALSAPMTNGIFPHRYNTVQKKWEWNGHIKRILAEKQKEHALTADCSTTALWLLRFHKNLEPDDRIIDFCKKYADRLVKLQVSSGAIPSYISIPEQNAHEALKESAQSAISGLFLLEFFELTRDFSYKKVAMQVADFLERDVIPTGKYFDFETFLSCSTKPLDYKDNYTTVPPQNTLSMLWTAELLLRLGKVKSGQIALDTLCLNQQVWRAPFLRFHTFGGFGVQNTDAEWSDSRHALCAMVLMDAYERTKDPEYFERGIAALRGSFTLMVAPENKEVSPLTYNGAIFWKERHQLLLSEPDPRAFKEEDKTKGCSLYYPLGYSAENYGHVGGDMPSGRPGFDWAEGLYLAAAAWVRERYGDVYVDASQKRIFGINGCLASWNGSELFIHEKLGVDRPIEIAIEGDLELVDLKSEPSAHERRFVILPIKAGETAKVKIKI